MYFRPFVPNPALHNASEISDKLYMLSVQCLIISTCFWDMSGLDFLVMFGSDFVFGSTIYFILPYSINLYKSESSRSAYSTKYPVKIATFLLN